MGLVGGATESSGGLERREASRKYEEVSRAGNTGSRKGAAFHRSFLPLPLVYKATEMEAVDCQSWLGAPNVSQTHLGF